MRTVASRERHRRLPRACGIRPIGVPDPIKYSINVQSNVAGGNLSEVAPERSEGCAHLSWAPPPTLILAKGAWRRLAS